jgi:hypothetical protein
MVVAITMIVAIMVVVAIDMLIVASFEADIPVIPVMMMVVVVDTAADQREADECGK